MLSRLFTLLLLSLSVPAMAKVLCVKPDATGNGSGITWHDAFTDLQVAFDASAKGDQIWVFADTFEIPSNGLIWPRDVAVYGGFAGDEKNKSERSMDAYSTLLRLEDNTHAYYLQDAKQNGLFIMDGFALKNENTVSLRAVMHLRAEGDVIIANVLGDGVFVDQAIVQHVAQSGDVKMNDCTWLNFSTKNVLFSSTGHFLLKECVFDGSLYENPLFDVEGKVMAKNLEIDGEMWSEAGGPF